MAGNVKMGFEPATLTLPLDRLLRTRALPAAAKQSERYKRIVASIREVGVIEPLVVHPQKGGGEPRQYVILDGHLRVEALLELGRNEAPCIVSRDDEGFTYNRHVSRLAPIQEHFMLLKALSEGVPEERLARALNVDVKRLREKRDLLRGVCAEAVEILKEKEIGAEALRYIRMVKPLRQIEMAELMAATNNYTLAYARALYLATPKDNLADPERPKEAEGVSSVDIARMEKEMETLERDFRLVEDSYGKNVLNLVVARNYLARLLSNARVARFLSQHHPEILAEFQKIVDAASLDG